MACGAYGALGASVPLRAKTELVAARACAITRLRCMVGSRAKETTPSTNLASSTCAQVSIIFVVLPVSFRCRRKGVFACVVVCFEQIIDSSLE